MTGFVVYLYFSFFLFNVISLNRFPQQITNTSVGGITMKKEQQEKADGLDPYHDEDDEGGEE